MSSNGLMFAAALFFWLASVYEIATIGFVAFYSSPREAPIVGSLLEQERWEDTVAPLLILAVFTWVLVKIFSLGWLTFREQSALNKVKVTSGKQANLKSSSIASTLSAQRFRTIVSSRITKNEAREIISAASAIDYGILEDRFGMTKVLVWTLPVLGFIGTAWGMSHAIGGFSQALQETTDMAVLTNRLSQLVIPGLAHAFSVTILALSTAAIAHFCVSAVQTWHSDVLTELDRVSLAWTETLPSTMDRKSDTKIKELLEVIASQLTELVNGLQQLESAGKKLGDAADALESAGAQVGDGGKVLKESITIPYNIVVTRGNQVGENVP